MKPILFNAQMLRAILDGRKTQTRRVVKPQPPVGAVPYYSNGDRVWHWKTPLRGEGVPYAKPTYAPGDVLYVRETWTKLYYVDPDGYTHFDQPMYYYAADGIPDITLRDADGFELEDQRIRWRPSIHMPREAARIFLRVTDVRVERLQDITIDDAIAEGCNEVIPITEFRLIWSKTIKPADRDRYGWAANPWVWVYTFKRCGKEGESWNG